MFDAISSAEDLMPAERTPLSDDDEFITPQQLADRWKQDAATLANLRARGEGLPFTKLPSGPVRYKLSDVRRAEVAGSRGFSWQVIANALAEHPGLSNTEAADLLTYLKKSLKD